MWTKEQGFKAFEFIFFLLPSCFSQLAATGRAEVDSGERIFSVRHGKMACVIGIFILLSFISTSAIAGPITSNESWFLDIFGGISISKDSDVDAKAYPFGVTIKDSAKNVDYDNTYTLGGRLGYWNPEVQGIGIALDVSYFKLETGGIDTKVFPVSPLVMIRYPGEKLQPYLGIGPGIFFTDTEIDIQLGGQKKNFSDTSVDVGLDTRAGLAWRLFKRFAIFGEYRFTYYEADYKDKISSGVTNTKVEIETENKVHHFLFGLSYRF